MPRILLSGYSTFFDPRTKTQFSPVLNRRTGCYVAVAEVTGEIAEAYKEREGFQVLTDAEFLTLTVAPTEPEPTESETGDPLTDTPTTSATSTPAAKAGKAPAADAGPPPPPPSG